MNSYEIDLEKIRKEDKEEQSLFTLLNHCDSEKLNLNQGKFNGHWYFGKSIEFNERLIDCIIFDDGKTLINWKQAYSSKDKNYTLVNNEISDFGIEYSDSLIPLKNKWSKEGLVNFVGKLKKASAVSVVSDRKEEMDVKLAKRRLILPLNDYLLIHNIESTVSTLAYTKTTSTTLTTPLTTLKNIQKHYMDLADERLFTLTGLYIISTYCFELFNSIGYLFFCSDSGSGKTKYADIIRFCSFNSINATNPSEAVLFRIIQQTKGTLFVDDYENIDDKKKSAIDQILKVGYKRGGQTIRAEKIGDNYVPKFFDVYSPKVITNTIGLDSITYSRCIPIHLLKTTSVKGKLNPNDFDPVWQEIRDSCYEFVMVNWSGIEDCYNSLILDDFNNRDLELVKPLLAIAKYMGDDIFHETKSVLLKIFGERDMFDFADDWDFVLFDCVRDYFGDLIIKRSEWLSAKDLLDLMLPRLSIDEGNAKPTVRWIGRTLTRIDLVGKRRVGKGVEYRFDTDNLLKYMQARGWYKGD